MTTEIIAVCDIETLSTRPNAVVLSIGVTPFVRGNVESFDILRKRSITVYLDKVIQQAKGRNITQDTVDWWEKQRTESPGSAFTLDNPRRQHPREAIHDLKHFLHKLTTQPTTEYTWYFRGPHFDATIIEDLCDDFNISKIWKYNRVRDVRTFLEARDFIEPQNLPAGFIKHDAACDASLDAWYIQLSDAQLRKQV